jgi:hypothetical protein
LNPNYQEFNLDPNVCPDNNGHEQVVTAPGSPRLPPRAAEEEEEEEEEEEHGSGKPMHVMCVFRQDAWIWSGCLDIADIKRTWLRSWLALVGKWRSGQSLQAQISVRQSRLGP